MLEPRARRKGVSEELLQFGHCASREVIAPLARAPAVGVDIDDNGLSLFFIGVDQHHERHEVVGDDDVPGRHVQPAVVDRDVDAVATNGINFTAKHIDQGRAVRERDDTLEIVGFDVNPRRLLLQWDHAVFFLIEKTNLYTLQLKLA